MRTFLMFAAVFALASVVPTAQTTATAQQVLDHHVTAIKAGDLNGLMSDYADDALVIAPHGIVPGQNDVSGVDVFAGKENVRKLFAVLTDAEHLKDIRTMQQTFESRGHDTMLMHWTQHKGTPQEARGTDIWVIRNGKVITQVVTVEAAKK